MRPDTPPLPIASPDDPAYQQQLRDEAAYWAQPHVFGAEALEDANAGPIERYNNRRLTGDPRTRWYEAVPQYGTFRRGLIVGASSMKQEARILETNPGLRITVCDISEGALERRARELAPRFPERIDTQAADLNFASWPERSFDLIVSPSTLHHVVNLERLAQQLNAALTHEGLLFVYDYVGPARFAFDAKQKAFFEALVRRAFGDGVRCDWPDFAAGSFSPFEAVRSSDTLPIFRRYLDEASVRTAGCVLGMALFSRIPQLTAYTSRIARGGRRSPLDAWRDRKLARFIDELIALDEICTDAELLPPMTAFAIYRKRKLA